MEPIRTKDKLFLAVVLPVALAAAYVYFWRTDADRRLRALAHEESTLVTVEDFPLERAAAERRLAAAKDELETERRQPAPIMKVKARTDDSLAARERTVLAIIRDAGLAVEQSRNAEKGDEAGRDVLVRTGLRPDPVCRQYALVGSYPQICAALRAFVEGEMAIIPVRVNMSAPNRWSLALWL